MSSLPPTSHDHDALLQALASGDLDPGDERARDELARCAECRAEAEVMLARIRRLEAAAEEQRRDLAAASALASAPGEDGVARLLASLAGAQPRPRRVPRLALLAAAALLLAAAGWWFARGTGEAPPAPGVGAEYLGAPLHGLVPSGTDQSFDEFRWDYDQGHDDGFVLRVYDADGTGVPLLEVGPLRTQTWTPTPAQRDLLPDRIVWEVEALDASGEVESGPVSASASRSSD
jgi:hypothetical protein